MSPLAGAAARYVLNLATGEDLKRAAERVMRDRLKRGQTEYLPATDTLAELHEPTLSEASDPFEAMLAELDATLPDRRAAIWTLFLQITLRMAVKWTPPREGLRELVETWSALGLASKAYVGDTYGLAPLIGLHHSFEELDELHAPDSRAHRARRRELNEEAVRLAGEWPRAHPSVLYVGRPAQRCARALLLSPDARVLLMEVVGSAGTLWITPGGRLEEGETLTEALARELHEELGLKDVVPDAEIWLRVGSLMGPGGDGFELEHIFLVRTETFEPQPANLDDAEAQRFVRFHWWSVEEIEDADDAFAPFQMGRLLRQLIEEGPPAHPIETGP
ncbi:MAG: NUDIX domain-containing protein [Planctomycetota bacterium]|nr:NUDIX domain-containing protein [Planctomycetota bacterium]